MLISKIGIFPVLLTSVIDKKIGFINDLFI